MIRFVDLFSGIGGLRLGFEQACNELNISSACVLSSEIDAAANETYAQNFSEQPLGDVASILTLPDFDFLLAGFPCQPFSHAGKQKGFDDMRGTLFFEIARILRDKKPRGFVLENVRGLTTNDGGRTFSVIMTTLEKLGYGVKWVLLNSCNFGVPQNRLRLFIIGLRDDVPVVTLNSSKGPPDSHAYKRHAQTTLFLEENPHPVTVRAILEQRPPKKYACSDEFIQMLKRIVGEDFSTLNGVRLIDYRNGNSIHSWELGVKGECTAKEAAFMNLLIANRRKKIFGRNQDGKKLTIEQIKTFYTDLDIDEVMGRLLEKGYLKKYGDRFDPVCGNMSFEVFKFLDPESISITLTSSDCHRLGIVQNNKPRRITPRECARLQGFPDSFILHPVDGCAYKQLGNSVSVPVVKAVLHDFLSNNYATDVSARSRRAI